MHIMVLFVAHQDGALATVVRMIQRMEWKANFICELRAPPPLHIIAASSLHSLQHCCSELTELKSAMLDDRLVVVVKYMYLQLCSS